MTPEQDSQCCNAYIDRIYADPVRQHGDCFAAQLDNAIQHGYTGAAESLWYRLNGEDRELIL